jgi:hypothetical protein
LLENSYLVRIAKLQLQNAVSQRNVLLKTEFYAITVVKLKVFKIDLRFGGGRSKSKRGPPAGHRWSGALPPHKSAQNTMQ